MCSEYAALPFQLSSEKSKKLNKINSHYGININDLFQKSFNFRKIYTLKIGGTTTQLYSCAIVERFCYFAVWRITKMEKTP